MTSSTGRWYLKCRKCRKVWAIDVQADPQRPYSDPVCAEEWRPCPHCGYDPAERIDDRGRRVWNYSQYPARHHVRMGKVVPGKKALLSPEYLTPCDGRCTNAKGPSCDCKCHGANHGTGRLIERWVPTGKVGA